MSHEPGHPETFAEWKQKNGGAAAAEEPDELGADFGLSGVRTNTLSGLRSPDRIDSFENLTITSSVGVQSMPPEQLAVLQEQLQRGGYYPSTYKPSGMLDDDTVNALLDLKNTAARSGMSDMDALTQSVRMIDESGDGGTSTDVRTSRSFQDYSRLDAEAVAENAFQAALGEDPSPKQIGALRKALNEYAKANPSTSTTTTTYKPGGDSSSVSTERAGMDAEAAAEIGEDFARSQPNYGEVQATTTYFNALLQALGPTTDVPAP